MLGKVASYYYLRVRRPPGNFESCRCTPCVRWPASLTSLFFATSQYTTVAMFATSLLPDNSLRTLLRILSSAAEYDELPVRHNEDKVSSTPRDEEPDSEFSPSE